MNPPIHSIWHRSIPPDRYIIVFDNPVYRSDYECFICHAVNPAKGKYAKTEIGEHLGNQITFNELPQKVQEYFKDYPRLEEGWA